LDLCSGRCSVCGGMCRFRPDRLVDRRRPRLLPAELFQRGRHERAMRGPRSLSTDWLISSRKALLRTSHSIFRPL
jgi:hypothetical protein